jgi:hypothetical protein
MKSIETIFKSAQISTPDTTLHKNMLWQQLKAKSAHAQVFEKVIVKIPDTSAHKQKLWSALKTNAASAHAIEHVDVAVPVSNVHKSELWSTLKEKHTKHSQGLSKRSWFQFFLTPTFAATCGVFIAIVGIYSNVNQDNSRQVQSVAYTSYQSEFVIRHKELVYRSAQIQRLDTFHTHLNQLDYYAQSINQ